MIPHFVSVSSYFFTPIQIALSIRYQSHGIITNSVPIPVFCSYHCDNTITIIIIIITIICSAPYLHYERRCIP